MRWKEIVSENSTTGSTSAASVAVSTSALGAGFDPDGDWGVYKPAKKKKKKGKAEGIVLRR